jgi:hypothetical protein
MRGTELAGGLLMSASPGDARWRVAAVIDLDGDGYSDLVFQQTDNGQLHWCGSSIYHGITLND